MEEDRWRKIHDNFSGSNTHARSGPLRQASGNPSILVPAMM